MTDDRVKQVRVTRTGATWLLLGTLILSLLLYRLLGAVTLSLLAPVSGLAIVILWNIICCMFRPQKVLQSPASDVTLVGIFSEVITYVLSDWRTYRTASVLVWASIAVCLIPFGMELVQDARQIDFTVKVVNEDGSDAPNVDLAISSTELPADRMFAEDGRFSITIPRTGVNDKISFTAMQADDVAQGTIDPTTLNDGTVIVLQLHPSVMPFDVKYITLRGILVDTIARYGRDAFDWSQMFSSSDVRLLETPALSLLRDYVTSYSMPGVPHEVGTVVNADLPNSTDDVNILQAAKSGKMKAKLYPSPNDLDTSNSLTNDLDSFLENQPLFVIAREPYLDLHPWLNNNPIRMTGLIQLIDNSNAWHLSSLGYCTPEDEGGRYTSAVDSNVSNWCAGYGSDMWEGMRQVLLWRPATQEDFVAPEDGLMSVWCSNIFEADDVDAVTDRTIWELYHQVLSKGCPDDFAYIVVGYTDQWDYDPNSYGYHLMLLPRLVTLKLVSLTNRSDHAVSLGGMRIVQDSGAVLRVYHQLDRPLETTLPMPEEQWPDSTIWQTLDSIDGKQTVLIPLALCFEFYGESFEVVRSMEAVSSIQEAQEQGGCLVQDGQVALWPVWSEPEDEGVNSELLEDDMIFFDSAWINSILQQQNKPTDMIKNKAYVYGPSMDVVGVSVDGIEYVVRPSHHAVVEQCWLWYAQG